MREGQRAIWTQEHEHDGTPRPGRGALCEAFLQSSGISKGTLWKLMRGEGNPTISLLQRIADSQKMSFIELLGLDPESVQKDLEKVGIDAEQLASFSKGEKRTRKTLAKMLEKSGA
jgi:transcriptional regulator with XRE-family HTH domain